MLSKHFGHRPESETREDVECVVKQAVIEQVLD